MRLKVTRDYLWLPVDMSREEKTLNIYADGKLVQEIRIRLAADRYDFYGAWKCAAYREKEIELVFDEEGILTTSPIRQEMERPGNDYPYRPKLHHTATYGWVNDPNGLVYADGVYHLFYQHNPYSTGWENMSWGHAVSNDLFSWKELDVAMTPDQYGTAYSGCGLVDRKNTAGCGQDALLFFYTAAGGRNDWSVREENVFSQRLRWSDDQGMTIHDAGEIIPWMTAENRDPKVFWHDSTKAYIMVLYLDGNDFLILRSEDLRHWKESQKLSVQGMWECPALMELPVEGTDEKRWVFWSADGYYVIGTFDGYQFTAQTDRLMAYFSRRAYAAQTYDNTGDRVIMVPWIRLDSTLGYYHGAMGIPQVLTLKRTKDGDRIAFHMPEEMEALRGEWAELPLETDLVIADEAREIQLFWKPGTSGKADLAIGETVIRIDFTEGKLSVKTSRLHELDTELCASFNPAEGLGLQITIDQEMIDVLGQGGVICGTIETEENVLGKTVRLNSDEEPETFRWTVLGK